MRDDWYIIHDIEKTDTPALVIYPERVKENIETLKQFVPDTNRLRPHVKTHKSSNVTRLLLEAGIIKFKCATISEAEMLAMSGAPDVLLAYQPVGPKVTRLIDLIKKYSATTFSCLVDNLDAALLINDKAQQAGLQISVFVDLNTGMNRTGIQAGPLALELCVKIQKFKNVRLAGLHAYDGHIRDSDMTVRTSRCNEAFEQVDLLVRNLSQYGIDRLAIIAGGSPTFPIHAKRSGVECSPGTFIYWDKGYHDMLPEQPFNYAALVIARIVSKPQDDIICIDLGHKSIASENPLNKRVFFLNADDVEPVGHSEEHMILKVKNKCDYKVGDVLYGVPYHICPTCALYDTALTVMDHKVTGQWKIDARSRKLTV